MAFTKIAIEIIYPSYRTSLIYTAVFNTMWISVFAYKKWVTKKLAWVAEWLFFQLFLVQLRKTEFTFTREVHTIEIYNQTVRFAFVFYKIHYLLLLEEILHGRLIVSSKLGTFAICIQSPNDHHFLSSQWMHKTLNTIVFSGKQKFKWLQ